MGISYATREDVKSALDVAETARTNGQIDRAIAASTNTIEGFLHRRFYPELATRYFDWPNTQGAPAWTLYLGADELISITTITAGGTTIAATDYFLEPANSGPPYTRIEIDLASSAAFEANDGTHQRAIAITGLFGHSADEDTAGTLAAAVSSTTATTIAVSDSAAIGVGSIIKVDSERMIVTGKAMLTTGQTVQTSALTAAQSNVTVNVTTGSAYTVDETILIDSERMLIVDIAGNALTVRRAYDGTVLAAHSTGTTIYAPRTLTVTRGALGTTAATHSSAAAITVHVVPDLVRELAVAETLVRMGLRQSGYARAARTFGSGGSQNELSDRGLRALREDAATAYGRKARNRAI